MAAFAQVLLALNLETDLELVGKDDELGRHLQDLKLRTRARASKGHGSATRKTV
jgi:hypothetical protein